MRVLELSLLFPGSVCLEFKIGSLAMRVGCVSKLHTSFKHAACQYFSYPSPLFLIKGHWCFMYSNILGGCLPAPCVTWKFSISLWHWCLFSLGSAVLWGKLTTKTCKHKNYWPRTLFKVYEMLSVPLGQLMVGPQSIIVFFLFFFIFFTTAKDVGEKGFYSCLCCFCFF